MSEPVSALQGAVYGGAVEVKDAGPVGMVTLRGNLASDAMATAVRAAVGTDMPTVGQVLMEGGKGCLWMSPDEAVLIGAYAEAETMVSRLNAALSGQHFLAVDVSDARTLLHLVGAGGAIRDVLSKLSPADLRPGSLPPGVLRRSRLAQVPAAFWFNDNGAASVICFRSVSDYVFELLSNAAKQGSEPDFH